MNPAKKHLNKNELISYIISVLIHGITLITLIIVVVKFPPIQKNNSILHFTVITPLEQKKTEKIKPSSSGKVVKHIRKTAKTKITPPQKKNLAETTLDTNKVRQKVNFSKSVPADTSTDNLKYAKTFLDTFLVNHPEYARYILQQQAKNFVNNKNDTMFAKLENQKKINNELHKYLKENFPEGSEHAIDKNLGPGIHIPIDGVIDAIRKIFK